MTQAQNRREYRLGLDLGAKSLGWQVVLLKGGEPAGIAACGVHTFDAGVDGDIEGGRDESRAAARRQARQIRRQFWRRQRRRLKVLRLRIRFALRQQPRIRRRAHHPAQPLARRLLRQQDALLPRGKPAGQAQQDAVRGLLRRRNPLARDDRARQTLQWSGRRKQAAKILDGRDAVRRNLCRFHPATAQRHALCLQTRIRISWLPLWRAD